MRNRPLVRRIGFQIEVGWKFTLHDGWAYWAFHYRVDNKRQREGYEVFWPSMTVQVLGLNCGLGCYYAPWINEEGGPE